jgi:hypothetical protein
MVTRASAVGTVRNRAESGRACAGIGSGSRGLTDGVASGWEVIEQPAAGATVGASGELFGQIAGERRAIWAAGEDSGPVGRESPGKGDSGFQCRGDRVLQCGGNCDRHSGAGSGQADGD